MNQSTISFRKDQQGNSPENKTATNNRDKDWKLFFYRQATRDEVRTQAAEKKSNIDEGNNLILQLSAELEKEKTANEKRRKLLTLLPESEANRQKMEVKILFYTKNFSKP